MAFSVFSPNLIFVRIKAQNFITKFLSISSYPFSTSAINLCSQSTQHVEAASTSERYHAYLKTKKISKAMEAYLKASREKAELFQKENEQYELGKRHLANMMGLDPETMNQNDIDEAIRYLLPSGLFSPRSRPTMKPPSYYYPPIKPADFAEDGRPFDDMFYTLRPKFYQHLYQAYEKIDKLNEHSKREKNREQANTADEDDDHDESKRINLIGTSWPNAAQLEERFMEKMKEEHERQYAAAMDHLIGHPYAYLEKEFILNSRVSVTSGNKLTIVEKVTETKIDKNGRIYAEAEARRKVCNAVVKVYPDGSGRFDIDGNDLMQFLPHARECVLFPFIILDRHDQFDVEATTEHGGESSRAGAVRFGICKALCPFLTEREIEILTKAGLLSRDIRRKERSKWNRYGARVRPKYKRR